MKKILLWMVEIEKDFQDWLVAEGCELWKASESTPEQIELVDLVLVGNEVDVEAASVLTKAQERLVPIYVLGEVKNRAHFFYLGGRGHFHQKCLEQAALKNFLSSIVKSEGTLHLEQALPQLTQLQEIKVLSPHNMGHVLDEWSVFSHTFCESVVETRTFADHLFYYLFYLQQAGITFAPFEVQFGLNDSQLFFQVHLPVKNYVAEYLVDSFELPQSQAPLKYLLGVCLNSTDGLILRYCAPVSRLIVMGVWGRNRESRASTPYLILDEIKSLKQYQALSQEHLNRLLQNKNSFVQNEGEGRLVGKKLPGDLVELVLPGITSDFFKNNPQFIDEVEAAFESKRDEIFPQKKSHELKDAEISQVIQATAFAEPYMKLSTNDQNIVKERLQKKHVVEAYGEQVKIVKAELAQDEKFKTTLGESLHEKLAHSLISHLSDEEVAQVFEGKNLLALDRPVLVSGSEDNDEVKIKVRGEKTKDDFIQKVSGSIQVELAKLSHNGKREKLGSGKWVSLISQSLTQEVKGDLKLKKLFSEKNVQEKIHQSLINFAQKSQKPIEDLTQDDLKEFAVQDLKQYLNEFIEVDQNFAQNPSYLKSEEQKKLLENFQKQLTELSAVEKTALEQTNQPQEKGLILRSWVEKSLKKAIEDQSSLTTQPVVESLLSSGQPKSGPS